jgi:steroid delta-isomerase-like uncharacterized protein
METGVNQRREVMADTVKIAKEMVDAFNASDWERSKKPLRSDSLYNEVGTGRKLRGSGEIIPVLQAWKEAMPDVKGKITKSLAADNTAFLEVTWEGTQTGPLESPTGRIPASGKHMTTPAAWVFEFDGDKIKECRQYFDMLSFLKQIGALPSK